MDTRKVSPRGILHKLNIAKDVAKTLESLKPWFETCTAAADSAEVYDDLSLLLITPEQAATKLKEIAFKLMMDTVVITAEKQEKVSKDKKDKTYSGFVARVYDKDGKIVSVTKETRNDDGTITKKEVELIQGFEMLKTAENWCHNRMWDNAACSYAIIANDSLLNKNTNLPIQFRVERIDATLKVLKKKKTPFTAVRK